MANPKHLDKLKKHGTQAWNSWRKKHPDIVPDLSFADLSKADLSRIDLAKAHLRGANLQYAILNSAILWKADLAEAQMDHAKLIAANLRKTNLFDAKLRWADLSGANLTGAQLVDTYLQNANLTGCFVYGVAVWDAKLEGAAQRNLVINDIHSSSNEWKPDEVKASLLQIDGLEAAQLVNLLQANKNIGKVIDTVSSKVVLILGRFTKQRKAVLDKLKEKLREDNLVPIIFDFKGPNARNLTETIGILAALSNFVIADITSAKSIPQELHAIVPALPSVPVQPIISRSQYEYGMFKDFAGYLSVLPPYRYKNKTHLLVSLKEQVIDPVTRKAEEIAERRRAFDKPSKRRKKIVSK